MAEPATDDFVPADEAAATDEQVGECRRISRMIIKADGGHSGPQPSRVGMAKAALRLIARIEADGKRLENLTHQQEVVLDHRDQAYESLKKKDERIAALEREGENMEHAMAKRREFMEMNTDWDEDDPITDDDVLDDLMSDCGRIPGGGCTLAGTEQCDFECPFRD